MSHVVWRLQWSLLLLLAAVSGGIARAQSSPQEAVRRIIGALQTHDFPAALSLSQSALAAYPNDDRIWTLRGMATAGMGNLPLAREAYQHALKLAPNNLAALEGAAQTEFQLGHDAAAPLLQRILAQRPGDPTAHTLLGILEYRHGNCMAAVNHLQQGGSVAAHQPEALTDEASCLAALHRDTEAVDFFAQALALDPARPQARFNLALAQWKAGHAQDGLQTLQPLLTATPGDADALELAAEMRESMGDTAQAVALLRSALLANPKDLQAYLQFATLSFDHASPQVGIDLVNTGLKQLPHEPRLYLVRGILLAQLGEFSQAADDFAEASRLDPRLQFTGVAEGLVESQQHNPQEAIARFRASVRAHPNEAYAHYLLAEALVAEGEPEGSPEYLEEIAAAKKAVQLDPGLVAAHDLLSSVYYEKGHIDLAMEQSRAALAHNPNDEQAIYHLILALRKTGQTEEVRTLVKRLVALRADSRVNQPPVKRYRLYEQPAAASVRAP